MIERTSRFVVGALLSFLCFITIANAFTKREGITLNVNNPYKFNVDVRVKCDWQNETKAFAFDRKFLLKRERVTEIKVPAGLNACQIWPHLRLF